MAKGTTEGKLLDVKTTNYDGKEKTVLLVYSGDEVCKVNCGLKDALEYTPLINSDVIVPTTHSIWNMNGKSGISYRIVPSV